MPRRPFFLDFNLHRLLFCRPSVISLVCLLLKKALYQNSFLNYDNEKDHRKTQNVTFTLLLLCSWTIISVLRYAYIVHPECLHSTFPDSKKLRNISLSLVLFMFATFVIITFGSLTAIARPYGWPQQVWISPTSRKQLFLILKIIYVHKASLYLQLFHGEL